MRAQDYKSTSGPGSLNYQSPSAHLMHQVRNDAYHNSFLIGPDEALQHAVETSEEHDLPAIAGARRILEVGTLGGFSAIWLACALPVGGELVSLELSEKHAQGARDNLAYGGLASKVQVIVGPAADNMKALQLTPPFDLVFIDADKPGNLTYFLEAKRLVRKGGVIVCLLAYTFYMLKGR
ncbi:S-adenosyl-L-methionine-dependent methyltransferase [Amylocystis lapponica]|nr:S-adenosyl-L-methionine-dependent methyltransferase [Amylocystis lapponica]